MFFVKGRCPHTFCFPANMFFFSDKGYQISSKNKLKAIPLVLF